MNNVSFRPFAYGSLALAASLLTSCVATHLNSVNKEPGFNPKAMQRVLVIALVRQPKNQHLIEDTFVKKLAKRNVSATPSYTIVQEGQQLDLAAWKKVVADNRFDSVIVTKLIDLDVTEKDVDSKYLTSSGGGGYGYYNSGYRVVYQPGFTLRTEVAAVETRVFDAAQDKMMWTAQSKTDIEQGRDPVAQINDFVGRMMTEIYK